MSPTPKQDATLSCRIPQAMRAELEERAAREANNVNAVVRRLLAAALAQERATARASSSRRRAQNEAVR